MKKLGFIPILVLASPALAHQGDHTGYDIAALVTHFFEWDHLLFSAIAVITGILCFRAGRRAEARAQSRKDISK